MNFLARHATFLLLACGFASCTVIGRGVGTYVDRRTADPEPPTTQLVQATQGRDSVVRTLDGRRHAGRVSRIALRPDSTLVFAAPVIPQGAFAVGSPESLRVPVDSIASIALPGSTARDLCMTVGAVPDAYVLIRLALLVAFAVSVGDGGFGD